MQQNMNKLLTEKFSKILLLAGLTLLAFAILIFVWRDWNFDIQKQIQADKIGQFGDFVGGLVGSIWALAGVVLFYVALTEQRKDFRTNKDVLKAQMEALGQQIKEFELQREELAETREVFKIQSDTLKKQQFESTFFNLLNIHHMIVNSLDLTSIRNKHPKNDPRVVLNLTPVERRETVTEITTGRDCFVKFSKGLKNQYNNIKSEYPTLPQLELAQKAYLKYYKRHQSDLGHYFRNLYHIFKFIKSSKEEDKNRYTSIVRAQLSNDELVLLFYNCLVEQGEKFRPYIEEFHLLKNINPETLIEPDKHPGLYNSSAYGDN